MVRRQLLNHVGAIFPLRKRNPGGGGGTWVNYRWVCAAGHSEPLPHYSLFCGPIIDPILVTFGQMEFSRYQLTHFLFIPLPNRAF